MNAVHRRRTCVVCSSVTQFISCNRMLCVTQWTYFQWKVGGVGLFTCHALESKSYTRRQLSLQWRFPTGESSLFGRHSTMFFSWSPAPNDEKTIYRPTRRRQIHNLFIRTSVLCATEKLYTPYIIQQLVVFANLAFASAPLRGVWLTLLFSRLPAACAAMPSSRQDSAFNRLPELSDWINFSTLCKICENVSFVRIKMSDL